MKVSELAELAGVSPAAIRFYEAEGILPPAARAENGYRDYTHSDLCRVRLIVSLRGLGLGLPECGRLAALCQDGQCDTMERQLLPRLDARREAVARARAELDHLDTELAALQLSLRRGERSLPVICSQERRNGDAT